MDEPTQEQIKEFWEWSGLPYGGYGNADRLKAKSLPPIDLNNLFKYAVPRLEAILEYRALFMLLVNWIITICGEDIDPALALFWALWQTKENKND